MLPLWPQWAYLFVFVLWEFLWMWSYLRSPPFMMVMTRQSSSFVWKAYASDTMKRLWTFSRILFSTIAPYRTKDIFEKQWYKEKRQTEIYRDFSSSGLRKNSRICVPFEKEVKLSFKEWPQTSQGQDITVPRSSIQKSFLLKLPVITLSLSQLFNTAG